MKSGLPLNDWFIPTTYTGIIFLTYIVGFMLGWMTGEELVLHPSISKPIIFPFLLILLPPVLAPINLAIGGDLPSTLAIGLVPGISFFILSMVSRLFGISNGDSSPILLSISFMGIGLIGAIIGGILYLAGKNYL